MTVNTAYRHGDYPVEVNHVFAKRVQDVGLPKNQATQNYFEMGNFGTTGSAEDAATYAGNLRWFPIDNTMECLFAGYATSGCTINLADFVNTGLGVPVKTLKSQFGGCKVTSLEYTVQAQSEFAGTVNFEGNERLAGGAIVAVAPSGVPCYKGKDVCVSVDGTPGVRVSGLTFRANIPSDACSSFATLT